MQKTMKRFWSPFGLDNLILATGGACGITLTLTPSYVEREDGATITSVYAAMKVDQGAGVVVFVDPKGALFNGQASWRLAHQHEFAIFIWDGSGWHVCTMPKRSVQI